MKNLFLSLTLILISLVSSANNDTSREHFNGEILLEQTCDNDTITTKLNFKSLNDFNNFDLNQIDLVDDCEVTVEVTVSATIGVASVSVSLSATVPCDDVKDTIKDLTSRARDALGL